MISADYVRCGSCNAKMYVVKTTEVCPKCKTRGCLTWANEDTQEVEVHESEVVNLEDYESVINDTEESEN